MNPQSEPAAEQPTAYTQPEHHQSQQQSEKGSHGTDPSFDEVVWDFEYGRP